MSVQTLSEKLFETLCSRQRLRCLRIPEGKTKTADYEVVLRDTKMIVEVKQLDPSEKDKFLNQYGVRPIHRVPWRRLIEYKG